RRDRWRLRLGLGELQVAAAGLAARQQGPSPPAGRARTQPGAHPHGRAFGVRVREKRSGPQSGRAGDQPAGVSALLYRAARPAARVPGDAALGLRCDHGRQAIPPGCREHAHRHRTTLRRQGAGPGAKALFDAEGYRGARAPGGDAVGAAMAAKPSWKRLLARGEPLLLPCAHDALTVSCYEAMGASAIFIEDQRAPKRCGHMSGKEVIDAEAMAGKLRAAAGARNNGDLFIIARTDARAVHGLDEALRRAELYLKAGADGLFIEAPQSVEELAQIGRTFQGVPQIANMLEGGGRTPVLPPHELYRLGFAMI